MKKQRDYRERQERKANIIMCLVLGLIIIAGVAAYLIFAKPFDEKNNPTEEQSELTTPDPLSLAAEGDIVSFGNYNGNTEWIVVKNSGDSLLLLSKNIIEKKAYNDEYVNITWGESSIRKWLNGEYLNSAFSEEERAKILESLVINSDNPDHGTRGGASTEDRIFLLSLTEVNGYLASKEDKKG